VSPRLRAILQAFFVTFLWATSWPLIKIGLQEDLPPLTFAGMRYVLAAAVLWLFTIARAWARRNAGGSQASALAGGVGWTTLVLLGLLNYSIPFGAQFVGLRYLAVADAGLVTNFTAIVTALLSAWLVREPPSAGQVGGILLALGAALGYFYPFNLSRGEMLGVMVNSAGMLASAVQFVIKRGLMRGGEVSALWLTRNTMTIGGLALLTSGLLLEEPPVLTARGLGIIAYLAVVNTAFTFTLWNLTLRVLTAPEASAILNTMLVQIAILAWLTLGERPTLLQGGCLVMVALATAWVQLSRREGAEALPVGSRAVP
jgi:drug/metabolite transporter (DMT)-like permease